MFSTSSVKLDKELARRAAEHARNTGFSSLEHFLTDLITKELNRHQDQSVKDKLVKKLKGLGYL